MIIHRFDHRTPGRTHGHHTSSALLSHQAFSLTNDPNSYPEQLTTLKPWQVRRQFFNTSWWFYGSRERFKKADKINLLALKIGNYDALKGISNSEIAAASRSSHKSQGFGSSPSLGARTEYIELVNGDRPASNDPFEGINTTWTRLEGGEKIGKLVTQALEEFDFKAPQKSVPLLVDIHQAIKGLSPSVWKNRKLKAVKALIKSCAGLTLQLNSDSAYGIAGENLKINFNSVHQSEQEINIKKIGSTQLNKTLSSNIAYKKTLQYSLEKTLGSPYWLLKKEVWGI